MHRNLIALLIWVVLFSACTKTHQKNSACGTQVCSDIFTAVEVHFTDNTGKSIKVSNFTVFDVTSNKQLYPGLPTANLLVGYYTVASDSNIKDYSTDGDVIKVSGTDSATGQTKTVNFKISGGCNCHVAKISGPDSVAFD
ncbi:hypothetical protein ACPPVU_06855 [Mucilaginibacter sp. McL0603]|uniref:hypothetical protein n=1 Tax=Mucilaginibacter sp. McL0603 TaxID=3415670 RepID=UPI003CE9B713